MVRFDFEMHWGFRLDAPVLVGFYAKDVASHLIDISMTVCQAYFLTEIYMRTHKWFEPGAQQFREMLDDASATAALKIKTAYAAAFDAVMQFPRSGGTPLTIKGVELHKQLSGKFILLSRYDADLDEVELVGFYYQNSSYHSFVAAIL